MLKKLAKRIHKEVEQAEDYCTQAYLVRHHSSQTADLFRTLANEELTHAEKLLREGQRLLDTKQLMSYDKDAKESMEDAAYHEKCKHYWEWEYRIAMDRILEIKYKLSQMN